MREKFYGLLREYLLLIPERDFCEQQARTAPEGIEQAEAKRRLVAVRKRCRSLQREIRSYPDINKLPANEPNRGSMRYTAQAR